MLVASLLVNRLSGPFELLVDGDLLVLVIMLVVARGPGTTAIFKVKGHADEGFVRSGRVREEDRVGDDMADEAAHFHWRRIGADGIDARRDYTGASRVWCSVVRDLHRFFIAIAGTIVNDYGQEGIAPDPMVWSSGGRPERRRVVEAIRDFAMLPGPQRLWFGDWFKGPDILISAHDVGRWPFSVGALVKLAAFLSCLCWLGEVSHFGSGGISYVELLIVHERWAGERLRIEDSVPKYRRPGRPISVSAAPLCPDADLWKLCRFFGSMMRALKGLPGCLGRFILGRIGANHGRLRHIGWEKCCQGLTCRPREFSGEGFLGDLSSLLATLMGLVVPCWMVPSSLRIILLRLLTGNLAGGFLSLNMWLTSSPLEVRKSAWLGLNL